MQSSQWHPWGHPLANPTENEYSVSFFFFFNSWTLAKIKNVAATVLFDLFNTISGYKNLEYFNSSSKSKILLLMWGSLISHRCGQLVYLMHTFKCKNGTNSENNFWRNLMNQQECFKLTVSIQALLLNEKCGVVNKNISLDGRMNSSWYT